MPVDVSDDVTVDVADVVCVVLVVGEVVGDEVSDVDGVVDGLVVGEVDVVRVVVGEVVWVVMMHSLLKSPSWYVLMALLTKSTVARQASIVEKVIKPPNVHIESKTISLIAYWRTILLK